MALSDPLTVNEASSRPLTFIPPHTTRALCTFHPDGRVELAADLNLDDVKGLPTPYLRILREIVDVALRESTR